LRCLNAFSHRPISSIKGIAETTGLSYPSVSKAMEKLEELGIVKEITGKERNRAYGYERFLGVLNDDLQV